MSDVAEEEAGLYEAYPEGYELEGAGEGEGPRGESQVEESETTVLFGRLGDELHQLVQRYNMPPADLEDLFQVWSLCGRGLAQLHV